MSVWGNLLFVSVESTAAKKDCTSTPPATATTRFRGIRIFDISNIDAPRQIARSRPAAARTRTRSCVRRTTRRTSTSTSRARPACAPTTELAGCDGNSTDDRPANPSQWRIEVIKVPLATPTQAAVVNEPRLFKNERRARSTACRTRRDDAAAPVRAANLVADARTRTHCHDITVYEELDLAAGACEGNGLLIDISDPANPKRIDAVADPLFAYWHGATFSNDGKAVVFTDEWGGGSGARCRATDQLSWGADAIYEIVDRKLVFRSYYKLPVAQTTTENCVSHVGNLIPIPGRNVLVQAWYQGGVSVMDFTDLRKPEGDRATSTAGRSARARSSSPAASGRRTGTTAASTARRSRAASTRSSSRRRRTCRRARSPRPSASPTRRA